MVRSLRLIAPVDLIFIIQPGDRADWAHRMGLFPIRHGYGSKKVSPRPGRKREPAFEFT